MQVYHAYGKITAAVAPAEPIWQNTVQVSTLAQLQNGITNAALQITDQDS